VGESPAVYRTPIGDLQVADAAARPPEATLLIRPEAAHMRPADDQAASGMTGRMLAISFRGRHQVAKIAVPAGSAKGVLKLEFDSDLVLPPVGEDAFFVLRPEDIILLE
jgi:hypothetical protein